MNVEKFNPLKRIMPVGKAEARPVSKRGSSVEIDSSLLAYEKFSRGVAAAVERLVTARSWREKVQKEGVGGATMFGLENSAERKLAGANDSIAEAERDLKVWQTADEAFQQAGTAKDAIAILNEKEADLAKKISKKHETGLLDEDRAALGELLRKYADARKKIENFG